jgi:hypothetical protein
MAGPTSLYFILSVTQMYPKKTLYEWAYTMSVCLSKYPFFQFLIHI